MQKLGKDMGDYVIASTTETDDNRMVKNPGTINGGFKSGLAATISIRGDCSG